MLVNKRCVNLCRIRTSMPDPSVKLIDHSLSSRKLAVNYLLSSPSAILPSNGRDGMKKSWPLKMSEKESR